MSIDRMRRLGLSILPDYPSTEDLIQEAWDARFTRLYQAWKRYDPDTFHVVSSCWRGSRQIQHEQAALNSNVKVEGRQSNRLT